FGATSPADGGGGGGSSSTGLAGFPVWFLASSGFGLLAAGLLGRWVWTQSRNRRTMPAGLRLRPGSS
ncbi:MAG: hypothetical protein ACRDH9_03430, partial [Actinomycetota bacterium]